MRFKRNSLRSRLPQAKGSSPNLLLLHPDYPWGAPTAGERWELGTPPGLLGATAKKNKAAKYITC